MPRRTMGSASQVLLVQTGLDAPARSRVHVVGYSYAGTVALQLAADHPDRVAGLVLVAPPPVLAPEVRTDVVAPTERLPAVRRGGTHAAQLATAISRFVR